jgi:uncharacterized damage-inducible protein DinB
MSSSTAVSSNSIASVLIAEMEKEASTTRKTLERIPAEKFGFKPHERSMAFGQLASHIAEMYGWTNHILEEPELDFAKLDYKPFEPKSTEELVAFFEKQYNGALESLRKTSDETFMEPWTLRNGDQIYFTQPKAGVMRGMVMNHIVHHRGQLSVYLRLNEIPVPSLYGPSADEGMM